jgi:hypothetical protein
MVPRVDRAARSALTKVGGAGYGEAVIPVRRWFGGGLLLLAALVSCTVRAASPVVIDEFLARNATGLADDAGDRSDWIELYNRSNADVNLEGWFLTDDPDNLRRWRLPATNLVANGYLVVFASGENRGVSGLPLHTDFRLDGSGEYLALVMPDGRTVASEFAPQYPEQYDDVSFGQGTRVASTRWVASGVTARYRIPADGSLEAAWKDRDFDDTGWAVGRTAIGFASDSELSGSGLFAYWPIREGAGGVASNLVAGGAHGLLRGAAWATDPVRGTVLSFDGRESYVTAGTVPPMGTASNFTWSVWYRQRSVPNLNSVILGNRSGGAPGSLQFIKFTPSNFEYYRDGNIGFIPHFVASGAWRHLAVVKQAGSLNYYDNGVPVGASRVGGDLEANPFYWGGDPGAPGECVDGLIDDIALWTTALTPDQIRSLVAGVSPAWMSGLGGLVATDVGPAMRGRNATAYVRIPFTVAAGAAFDRLTLRVRYDDGFVAYLNGVEVARRNAPAVVGWNATATAERPTAAASAFEAIDITAGLAALGTGYNLLAIQGLNRSAGDADFLLEPELEATGVTELGWRHFAPPTPGAANDTGYLGVAGEVAFDRPRGFHDTPFDLTLACATPGVTIRYTTDGTEPSAEHGSVYQAPLAIRGTTVVRAGAYRDGYYTPRTDTRSYLFLNQVLVQTGAGLPGNWGGDWQMDPRVVNHPDYAGRIRDDMKSLPVVSVALDPMGFWGPTGIYTLTAGRGDEYERAASAEMFFPDGSEPGFQINCGVQIVGGASRTMTPKHGIGLVFKPPFGPPKLRYKFFPNSDVDAFDFLAFRPNFNMSWVRTDNSGPLNNANADGAERLHAIYVRDQFTKESQLAMGQPSAHERFVHLYINGVYWGLYNPSERTDASFAANYLGGEKEDYDAIFSDGSTVARAHDGDKNAWLEMMAIARAGVAGADAYARLQQHVDVTNLADYMMLNFYCATVDWPWQNWNAARKREPGARFRFFIWDAEYTLETPPWVPDDRTDVGASSADADSPARIYHELRKNPEWRLLFADRVQKHCFGGGALTTNQTIPRFLALCDGIDRAIVGESARWGDVVRRSQPYTRNVEWLAEKQRLLTQFFPQRTGRVVQQFIRAGLYPALAAPVASPPGGEFTTPFQLELSVPAGSIYYTTDGRDPRLPGGAPSTEARLYTGPIPIDVTRSVAARTWRTNAWSALMVAEFTAAPPPPALVVRVAGPSVVISWPSEVTGFDLETADRLSTDAVWSPVDGAAGNQVELQPAPAHRFFRLRMRP